ncbi:MAG: MerR family transcriptional regulator [Actinobacteria bacterium]|nr:MerR family transcriptional regulator [Actinomycetota bacterium]
MRISELSAISCVPLPTIKYYLREGLLQPGILTARNRAEYEESHLHRLRLIRVLREVGGLGIASVRAVVEAVADEGLPMHDLLGLAHHALGPPADSGRLPSDVTEARLEVDGFLADLGWLVSPQAPSRRTLANALVALRRLGREGGVDVFRPYADLADGLAGRELQTVPTMASRADAIESVVVGTVVFEAALIALRRLAQEHHSARKFARTFTDCS